MCQHGFDVHYVIHGDASFNGYALFHGCALFYDQALLNDDIYIVACLISYM